MNYKVEFINVTKKDREEFISTIGSSDMLNNTTKIVVTDEGQHTGILFLQDVEINKLGEDYIKSHVTLRFCKPLEDWFVKLSQNDYHNDLSRNPEKEIEVEFCGIQKDTVREIYRNKETKEFYLREVAYHEDFAKWLVCGKKKPDVLDDSGDEPRPNLIFVHNGQKEKIRYDDWNGVCAYSDTFNKFFNFLDN